MILPSKANCKDAIATSTAADTLEVHFRVGQSEIDLGYANNGARVAEFTDFVKSRYAHASKESMQLNIYAGASPEGPSELNRRLGEQRGLALKQLLADRLGSLVEHVTVVNQGARWGALAKMIEASNEPWKSEVMQILQQLPPNDEWKVDPREQKLKSLRRGAVWRVLNEKYLPELRSSGSAVLMELTEEQLRDTLVIRDTIIYLPEPCMPYEEPADTRPVWAVKTNLLLWGVIAPNVQVERALGRANRWSVEGEFFWPWWTWSHNAHAEQFMNLGLSFRYWLGNREKHHSLDGWYLGPSVGVGYYDFEWKRHEGWQGEYLNIYCQFGYQKRWGRRKQWAIDGGLGLGYIPTKYRHYVGSSIAEDYTLTHPTKVLGPNEEYDDHLMWLNTGWNHIFGLTHANISIAYMFGAKGPKPEAPKVVEPAPVVDERARIKAINDAEAQRQYDLKYSLMSDKEKRAADKDRARKEARAAKEAALAEKDRAKAEAKAEKQRAKEEAKAAKQRAKAASAAAKEQGSAKAYKESSKLAEAEAKAAEKAAAAEAKAQEKAAKEAAKAAEAEAKAKAEADKVAAKAAEAEAKAKAEADKVAAKAAKAEAKAKAKAEAEAAKAAAKASKIKSTTDKAAAKAEAEAAKAAAAEEKARAKAEAAAAKAKAKADAEAEKAAAKAAKEAAKAAEKAAKK